MLRPRGGRSLQPGAGTFLRFDPDAGFGIAILSNGEPAGVPEALAQHFFKYLYGQPMPAGCDHARLLALCRKLMMRALYAQKIANYERYHGKIVAIPDSVPQTTGLHVPTSSGESFILCPRPRPPRARPPAVGTPLLERTGGRGPAWLAAGITVHGRSSDPRNSA
jgi:hypothetical protein